MFILKHKNLGHNSNSVGCINVAKLMCNTQNFEILANSDYRKGLIVK